MKQIIKTAGTIMEHLRIITGWNFAGGMKGNTCILAANLVNQEGIKIQVSLEINNKDVEIKITALDGHVTPDDLGRIAGRLDFPIEMQFQEGGSFALIHHEPLGVLEFNVRGVVIDCIVPMADVVGEAVSGSQPKTSAASAEGAPGTSA